MMKLLMSKRIIRKKNRRGFARRIFVFGIAVIFLGTAAVFLVIFYFSRNLPTPSEIANRQVAESTKIYDRTGQVLLYEISNGEKRTVVPLSEIPRFLKDATISIEDERFYEEPAFDWKGIARAVWINLTHGRILQGGSTITQQLARNAFLSSEQTFGRKIRELILAVQLGRHYTKDEILGFYLNEIPYGPTIYGVEAASRAYFGKPAQELTLAESALLASIPKAPSYYSPWGSHTKELLGREQFALKKMADLKKITGQELTAALKAKISFQPQSRGILAPHFVMAVQDALVQKYGEDAVRTGGLRVVTTLDWELQQLAEKVVKEGSESNEKLYKGSNAALVSEDPKTGQVLALVGSRDYFDVEHEGNFNVAVQGLRQPGSALKPFVYLTAFEKGYTPETVVFDVPTNFDTTGDPEKKYIPENFDGITRGPVNLKTALAQSINIPAVKVLYLAGINDSLKTLHDFGVTTLHDTNRYGLSLVLGGGEVKLVDLVHAYSTLSQEGIKHRQSFVLRIEDSKGNILESYRDESQMVVDAQYPRIVNSILSDPDLRSGLYHNSLSLTIIPNHDTALKTGTSNDYRDAWTVGYSPNLATGVWAGNNDNAPMQRQGSSILAALPMWHAFMAEALKDRPPETFIRPAPQDATKPILLGDYTAHKQIHSILYYVDPKNPTGPPPENPEESQQFKNWEDAVLEWAKTNLPDFQTYNQTSSIPLGDALTTPGSNTPPFISIREPAAGIFIGGQISVRANIESKNNIVSIGVYFNNQTIKELSGDLGASYNLSLSFSPNSPGPQNLVRVTAKTKNGVSGENSVIVYKK